MSLFDDLKNDPSQPKRGRPKSRNPLSEFAQVRLTEQEMIALKKIAEFYHMSVSEYVRYQLKKIGATNVE